MPARISIVEIRIFAMLLTLEICFLPFALSAYRCVNRLVSNAAVVRLISLPSESMHRLHVSLCSHFARLIRIFAMRGARSGFIFLQPSIQYRRECLRLQYRLRVTQRGFDQRGRIASPLLPPRVPLLGDLFPLQPDSRHA